MAEQTSSEGPFRDGSLTHCGTCCHLVTDTDDDCVRFYRCEKYPKEGKSSLLDTWRDGVGLPVLLDTWWDGCINHKGVVIPCIECKVAYYKAIK